MGMLAARAHFYDASSDHLSARRCAWRVVLGWIMLPFFPISFLFLLFDPLNGTCNPDLNTAGFEQSNEGRGVGEAEEDKGS
jgi:hypothetical protein